MIRQPNRVARANLVLNHHCKQGHLYEPVIVIGLLSLLMGKKTKACLARIIPELVKDHQYKY